MKVIGTYFGYFIVCCLSFLCVVVNPYEKKISADIPSNVLKTSSVNYRKEEVSLRIEEDSALEEEDAKFLLEETELFEVVETPKETIPFEDTNGEVVEEPSKNEVIVGGLSAYGPDCQGCSGVLASGVLVSSQNYEYYDSTYGNIRIVAGDKSYPFGTIVKVSNPSFDPFYAIVLDRGGIGFGKRYLFDLLFSSEEEASKFGSFQNVDFEIIRIGY